MLVAAMVVLKKTMKLSLSEDTGSDSIIIINKMNLLQILFSSYHISLSFNQLFVKKLEAF